MGAESLYGGAGGGVGGDVGGMVVVVPVRASAVFATQPTSLSSPPSSPQGGGALMVPPSSPPQGALTFSCGRDHHHHHRHEVEESAGGPDTSRSKICGGGAGLFSAQAPSSSLTGLAHMQIARASGDCIDHEVEWAVGVVSDGSTTAATTPPLPLESLPGGSLEHAGPVVHSCAQLEAEYSRRISGRESDVAAAVAASAVPLPGSRVPQISEGSPGVLSCADLEARLARQGKQQHPRRQHDARGTVEQNFVQEARRCSPSRKSSSGANEEFSTQALRSPVASPVDAEKPRKSKSNKIRWQ